MGIYGVPDAEGTSASVDLFGETFCITAATCAGRRRVNQDCFGWIASSGGNLTGSTMGSAMEARSCGLPDFLLAIVCDGLGGMRNGDKASRSVVDGMVEWAASGGLASGDPAEGIVRAATAIEGRLRSDHPRSGTTMSIVAAVGGIWMSAHLGDSRCYAVYRDRVWRTRDHSRVERLFREGRITEDQMNTHPWSNVMDLCMGAGDAAGTEVGLIEDGWQRLALCSDGAFGYMTVARFGTLLREETDAMGILESAYGSGSDDNITVLAVDRRGRRRARVFK